MWWAELGDQENRLTEALTEWMCRRGIELALFDLDDTLMLTRDLFLKQIGDFVRFVAGNDEGRQQILQRRIAELDVELFPEFSVSPERYRAETVVLAKEFPEWGARIKEGLPILHKIYSTCPEMALGATETLDIFGKTGVRLGVVTHANSAWTDIKIGKFGGRLNRDNDVFVVPEREFKTAGWWAQAIEWFGYPPEKTMVIGDNLKGDIVAAREAGVVHLVWLEKADTWHIYKGGVVPEGTIAVSDVGQLVNTLIGF